MDKDQVKKVAKQVFKEFWLPAIGAVAWTVLNRPDSITKGITYFSAGFFFVAWITGNLFRIKKQASVESSLTDIKMETARLVKDLKEATQDLIGHVTGGDSFCFVQPVVLDNPSMPRIGLVHEGERFPLFDVSVRIVDVELFNQLAGTVDTMFAADTNISDISLLQPRHMQLTNKFLNLGDAEKRRFNISIYCRNGEFRQTLRFVKVGERWAYATRVLRNTHFNAEVAYEHIDQEYPRDEDGKVDWEGFESPSLRKSPA